MEDLWGGFRPYKKPYPKGVYRVRDLVPVVWNITRRDQDCYIRILAADDLLADHPRQDPVSLQPPLAALFLSSDGLTDHLPPTRKIGL